MQGQRQRQRPRINHKDKNPPPENKGPQHTQQLNKPKTKSEYKPPDSNIEQNHAVIRFKSKNQGDGRENCKEIAKHKRIDCGNIKAAKKVLEKAAKTFSEFEETSYELMSQLEEDQHEEYIGKITDTWNNIDDIRTKNQEYATITFNSQDNNETSVAANSTADDSTINNNINTRATGQHQISAILTYRTLETTSIGKI